MPVMEGVSQQSIEWLHARVGMVTASRIADVMGKLKRKKNDDGTPAESAARKQYKKEIVYECMTGRSWDHYVSPAMEFGQENEELAKAAYEIEAGVEVEPGGFWIHDEISRFGASPDGLVGEHGLVEYKCPPSTHLDTLISGAIPPEYEWQMLAEMACTGRQWVDYVSFNPYFPKGHKVWIKRFQRNEERIKQMQDEVCLFLLEVIATIKKLEEPCIAAT